MTHARHLLFLITMSLCLHCRAVTGDGQVTKVKRNVGQFTALTIDGPFQIVTSDILIRIFSSLPRLIRIYSST